MPPIDLLVLSAYFVTVTLLSLFGLHRLTLVLLAIATSGNGTRRPSRHSPSTGPL